MNGRALESMFYYYLKVIHKTFTADQSQGLLQGICDASTEYWCKYDYIRQLWDWFFVDIKPEYVPLDFETIYFLREEGISSRKLHSVVGRCRAWQLKQLKYFEEHPEQVPDSNPRIKDIVDDSGRLIVDYHRAMRGFIETVDKFNKAYKSNGN